MQKLLTFSLAKVLAYLLYLMISFNGMFTNNIISFEQLGPGCSQTKCIDYIY